MGSMSLKLCSASSTSGGSSIVKEPFGVGAAPLGLSLAAVSPVELDREKNIKMISRLGNNCNVQD